MFTRALKVCDPEFLDGEKRHIFTTFKILGYPYHFINNCLRIANKNWYNPQIKEPFANVNNLSLPFSQKLVKVQKLIKQVNHHTNKEGNISLSFSYNNTLRSRLVKNSNREQNDDVGVYCIPCLDCNQSYIGETGRGLAIRLEEHKRACRLGSSYSAVATHSLDVGHRVGFRYASVVYNSNDRNRRRTIEGALINLNETFLNNKGGTTEDKHTNTLLCQTSGTDNCHNISATIYTAASPLSSQVSVVPNSFDTLGTGAYAEYPTTIPPEPPDRNIPVTRRITRSSSRRCQ